MTDNKHNHIESNYKETDSLLTVFTFFYQKLLDESKQSDLQKVCKRCVNRVIRLLTPALGGSSEGAPCDILVLHFLDPAVNPNLQSFLARLRRGFPGKSVHFHRILSPGRQFRRWCIAAPPDLNKIPLEGSYLAPYAYYLIKYYQPRMIITFLEWNPLAIILQHYAKQHDVKTVNIAHALTSNSLRCSIQSFDYYFVLGDSAVKNIQNNSIRVGSTRLVKTGFVHIDESYTAKPNKQGKVLYFSSWLAQGYESAILSNTKLVAEWADKYRPELLIKLHPNEDSKHIRRIFRNIPGVEFLDRATTIQEALSHTSLSILAWSSAAIESALMERPIVIANKTEGIDDDFLRLEYFFAPRAQTGDELEQRIRAVRSDYQHYVRKCRHFTNYHLAKKQESQQFMVDCLKDIFNGYEPPNATISRQRIWHE